MRILAEKVKSQEEKEKIRTVSVSPGI